MEPVTGANAEPSALPATSSVAAPSLERAEAMTRYNEALIAPLVAELAETRVRMLAQAERLETLARENGTLAERMAGLERVRDAAMAHARELEARLEAAATRPPEPAPNALPRRRRREPRWRRWVRRVVLGE